ncbi:MAG: FecR family protein [Janthinobacterium lividum]
MRIQASPGIYESKARTMSPDLPPEPVADAVAWRIRLREDAACWDIFADWLESDPRHAAAYERVAQADAGLDLDRAMVAAASPAVLVAANDDRPRWRRRAAIGGGAIAAALVLVVVAGPFGATKPDLYDVVTAPGGRSAVTIADGTRIELNGGSRIVLDRHNPRFAELASGEVALTVRHDAGTPFVLVAGKDRVQDVGTEFDVVYRPDFLDVEVAKGAVMVNPDGASVALVAGQTLRRTASAPVPAIGTASVAAIGAWRHGRLSYRDAAMADVAADLGRSIGAMVSVTPEVAARRFSGTLQIDRDQGLLFGRLSKLFDVDARRTADGWLLSARRRAAD